MKYQQAKAEILYLLNKPNAVVESCLFVMEHTDHTTVKQVQTYIKHIVPKYHKDWSKYTNSF